MNIEYNGKTADDADVGQLPPRRISRGATAICRRVGTAFCASTHSRRGPPYHDQIMRLVSLK